MHVAKGAVRRPDHVTREWAPALTVTNTHKLTQAVYVGRRSSAMGFDGDASNSALLVVQTMHMCETCSKTASKMLSCMGCYHAVYCSSKCQRSDWARHKVHCRELIKLVAETTQAKPLVDNALLGMPGCKDLQKASEGRLFMLRYVIHILRVRVDHRQRCTHMVLTRTPQSFECPSNRDRHQSTWADLRGLLNAAKIANMRHIDSLQHTHQACWRVQPDRPRLCAFWLEGIINGLPQTVGVDAHHAIGAVLN